MDELIRAFYEAVFELAYLKKRANEFQDFFSTLMEKCHPDDFIRVRPWGNIGDRKNDGYLKSERRIFQVYAPNEMEAAKAIAKIDEDFTEALPYWNIHFQNWTFVHNARDGLGPDVMKKLLDLELQHSAMGIDHWGFEMLRIRAFKLKQADLASLLGPAPSRMDVINVGHEQLRRVLFTIARQPAPNDQDYRPVSPHKIAANGLSDNVKALLTGGRLKSSLVGQFFKDYHDPTIGDDIVNSFKTRYDYLKKFHADVDLVFRDLHLFSGGLQGGDPGHEAAVLAVLAYLFDQCDIFERPQSEALDQSDISERPNSEVIR
jgi:hypothetical protein